MGSFDLQQWTRIGAMNLRMRKSLILKPGILRFMGRPDLQKMERTRQPR
jgi:hypothetical protein